MSERQHFVRVDFKRFKAFQQFSLRLRHFNVLVGPNNAGKSTILAAFRILAAAMRKARSRNAEPVPGPEGDEYGHNVDLREISVAAENIFYNYDDNEPALVTFKLSGGNELILFFPAVGQCSLLARSPRPSVTTAAFKRQFNCPIGFVPILGPVDQNEQLYEPSAARNALFLSPR